MIRVVTFSLFIIHAVNRVLKNMKKRSIATMAKVSPVKQIVNITLSIYHSAIGNERLKKYAPSFGRERTRVQYCTRVLSL
jgi:hypothetical protein